MKHFKRQNLHSPDKISETVLTEAMATEALQWASQYQTTTSAKVLWVDRFEYLQWIASWGPTNGSDHATGGHSKIKI